MRSCETSLAASASRYISGRSFVEYGCWDLANFRSPTGVLRREDRTGRVFRVLPVRPTTPFVYLGLPPNFNDFILATTNREAIRLCRESEIRCEQELILTGLECRSPSSGELRSTLMVLFRLGVS